VGANPFPEAALERPSFLVVSFHRDAVDKAAIDRVTQANGGPERATPIGRELFVDYPEGQARSTLAVAMHKARLSQANTARNWNTVQKLLAALDS
jgi:uncharacterized protein (DUF1697 family)